MINDKLITIATGRSRKETKWKNQELKWSDFAKRLKETRRTEETYSEYMKLSKPEQDDIKDVGGFVGGHLKGGRRKADSIEYRTIITLDADNIPADVDLWDMYTLLYDNAAVLYSTHKHHSKKPRLRLILPLNRKVSDEEYEAIARRITHDLGIDLFDDTTYQAHRLMYWPSTSSDGEFVYELQDGPWLDADKVLATYEDWTDMSSWPVSSRMSEEHRKLAKKQGDPEEKGGVIGAFCRSFNIHDVIDKYLSDVYTPTADSNRYTYANGSTAGGLVVYDDKFAYSHHSTDPCGQKLSNSFDLVRVHLYGDQDEESKPNTPVNKLPSFVAMASMASDLDEVKLDISQRKIEEAQEAFGDDYDFDTDDNKDWVTKLKIDKRGEFEVTLSNIQTIIEHDPNLKGMVVFNEFESRLTLVNDTPWRQLSEGKAWRDSDDVGLMKYLEEIYGIQGKQKIQDSITNIQNINRVHPIREYLDSLEWDGIDRVDQLLIDYLGAEDSEYTRAVTRKILVAAVARIYNPGTKFDYMVVMTGKQGLGKSSLISRLGKEWFTDSITTFSGKEAMEQILGNWIVEVGELTATKKSDIESVKQFISKKADEFRPAYGRHKIYAPRQCVFFGTTNDREFLRDKTGNRRFWVVDVGKEEIKANVWKDLDVDQVWAEAVEVYRKGEKLYLDSELEKIAAQKQEEHLEESPKAGLIREYLDRLLPENWEEMSIEERRRFIQDDDFGQVAKGTEKRDKICALEIWVELFNGHPARFNYLEAREINDVIRRTPGWDKEGSFRFGEIYGRQRGFKRD
jgi:putative DNA primase/helicase